MTAILDLIPLVAFFYFAKTQGVIAGAGALLIATLAVYVVHFSKQKGKLNKQQWVTLILTILFCGLSLAFNNDIFIKWKSVVINSVFAIALLISVIINKPLLKFAMNQFFQLSNKGWQNLTLAWVGYFVIMAGLQYYFAFFSSNETWINFKTYGWIPVMLIFMVGQFAVLKNHLNPNIQKQLNEKK
ncbi:intracellular septation protein A [Moraxella macacae 0408225]|uniref:Inner membrane-spanning protein YciB n=1 Tax=Moraxella macacae 0408225 TaxID=1230338 RepID=L2F6G4_9GAMM|nr:inner membrane-spanning protein YciB [Moraxella macacae]ELA08386.1 intracellular septation protein A [Moraxella macacae 0408225]